MTWSSTNEWVAGPLSTLMYTCDGGDAMFETSKLNVSEFPLNMNRVYLCCVRMGKWRVVVMVVEVVAVAVVMVVGRSVCVWE